MSTKPLAPNDLLSPGQIAVYAAPRLAYSRHWWRIQMLTKELKSKKAGHGVFARVADVDAFIEAKLAERGADVAA